MRREFRETPLGMGVGSSRFSSPDQSYKILYAALNLETAIAEVIVRDRFEAVAASARVIEPSEIRRYAAAEVSTRRLLRLLDLREKALLRLGFNTDAVGARAHAAGQAMSAKVHVETDLDGLIYLSRLTHAPCAMVYERAVADRLSAPAAMGLEQAEGMEAAFAALSTRVKTSADTAENGAYAGDIDGTG